MHTSTWPMKRAAAPRLCPETRPLPITQQGVLRQCRRSAPERSLPYAVRPPPEPKPLRLGSSCACGLRLCAASKVPEPARPALLARCCVMRRSSANSRTCQQTSHSLGFQLARQHVQVSCVFRSCDVLVSYRHTFDFTACWQPALNFFGARSAALPGHLSVTFLLIDRRRLPPRPPAPVHRRPVSCCFRARRGARCACGAGPPRPRLPPPGYCGASWCRAGRRWSWWTTRRCLTARPCPHGEPQPGAHRPHPHLSSGQPTAFGTGLSRADGAPKQDVLCNQREHFAQHRCCFSALQRTSARQTPK